MLTSPSVRHIGFFLPREDDVDDPDSTLEKRLSLIRRAETLGYDSAWISRACVAGSQVGGFAAAALRRTSRIAIGFGCERRELQDLTKAAVEIEAVDVAGSNRLHAEIQAIETSRLPGMMSAPADDLIYLPAILAGRAGGPLAGLWTRRRRVWCDAGSTGCAAWAGASGLNLIIGASRGCSRVRDAAVDPLALIEAYWNTHAGDAPPRVLANRVILPLDGAGGATRRRYEEFAAGYPDTPGSSYSGNGLRDTAALVGSAREIIDRLRHDPVLLHVAELRLGLPPGFGGDDHEQILSDFMRLVAPGIGHGRLH